MTAAPTFASASEAMDMAHAALSYLAAADATQLAAETQARCLQVLEQATSMTTAARAAVLAAFASAQGYCADAGHSPRAWLAGRVRVTKGAAAGYTAWARRAAAHPQAAAALAAGQMPESFARTLCLWTDTLPQDCRPAADAILLSAAKAGLDLRGWPSWPRSCWPGPSPTSRMRTRRSRTGRCGWRPPSRARAS